MLWFLKYFIKGQCVQGVGGGGPQGTSASHWCSSFWDTTFGGEYLTTNNNCATPFERNTTRWSNILKNVLSVFFKDHQIDQG